MRRYAELLSVLVAVLVSIATNGSLATQAQEATPVAGAPAAAGATLFDTTGHVIGVALLVGRSDGPVTVFVVAQGLKPGNHGLHVHETGACDPAGEKAFASAGGHYNPTGAKHGHHAGDLGNITIDAHGLGRVETNAEQIKLSELLDADGASIVIHANEDQNDPDGKSFGGRIACGVLTTTAPQLKGLATPTA